MVVSHIHFLVWSTIYLSKIGFWSSDISNITNNIDLLYILTAIIIIDLIVIIIAKTNNLGKQINIWYDKFGLSAVILDVLIILIGFIITRYIFSIYQLEFSPYYFIFILVLVQLVHDILLYLLVIKPIPKNTNSVIDVYKDYANENGSKILLADSLMMIGSAIIAMNLKTVDMHYTTTLLVSSIYIIPYLLYVKNY